MNFNSSSRDGVGFVPLNLPVINDASSASAVIHQLANHLRAEGIESFRSPPPEPTTCCGRGCNGCVWEGYFAAVAWWCDEALTLLSTFAAQADCGMIPARALHDGEMK